MNHDKIIEYCIESSMPYAERRMAMYLQCYDFTDSLSYKAYTEKTTLHINVTDKYEIIKALYSKKKV
jgi:ABC-type tungstate transport system permease subunit